MKRNNPNTNQPFKRGDVREDGYVFFNYTNRIKSTGFFMERWLNPEASALVKEKDKTAKKAKYERKTNRQSPGFGKLPPKVQSTTNMLRHIHEEQLQYKDLSFDDMVEMLVGYELSPEELDIAIQYAQPLCFDAKAVFQKVFSI